MHNIHYIHHLLQLNRQDCKKAVIEFNKEFIPIELLTSIRNSSKDSTLEELESLKLHLCLV